MKKIEGEIFNLKNSKEDVAKVSNAEINEKYKRGEIRIVTEQARYPIKSIRDMLESGDYKRNPEYQRRKRWDNVKKSRLIESFIMNVPLPPIFLYEYDYSKYEVMDGLQRLTAIDDFYQNKFKLENLEYWKELNGKRYRQLPSEIQKGIDRRYISSTILLAETAKTEEEAEELKRIIFERLNSGGEAINHQESRNALYGGKFNQLCIRLSENEHFRVMWKIPLKNLLDSDVYRKMDDVEYVLRFFAYRFLNNWKKTKKEFFDEYLKEANKFPDNTIYELEKLFYDTINVIWAIFKEKAFIPYNSNTPRLYIYDALMRAVSERIKSKNILLKNRDRIYEAIRSKQLIEKKFNKKLLFSGRYDSPTVILRRTKYIHELIDEAIKP
jgi:hypothetical protein